MSELQKVIPIIITFGVVLVAEIIKLIIKRAEKSKNVEVDYRKFEYPIYLSCVAIVFVGVMLYLRYGANNTDWGYVCTVAGAYAAGANTIYMLVIQAIRKIITKIIAKVKSSKNIAKDLPSIIVDSITDTTKELISNVNTTIVTPKQSDSAQQKTDSEEQAPENEVDKAIKTFSQELFNIKK